uniref:Uncharacterized protein n=1 Tax=Meloidogyne enterolobii TaxID=390850 RepID=A0A6V7VBF0_MELEN|nr:unnamed protein product [Meloidogyne enterolobii]
MDRPQAEGKSSKFSSINFLNLLQLSCLIILFLTLKQINLNAVNSTILEFFINFPLDFRHTAKSFTIILCLIAFSFYSFYELYWKRRFLPPGPVPWLVAGNMPQVLLHGASNIDLLLQNGTNIMMVMVSDVDLLKKYFIRNGDVFSGRWQNFITHMFMDGHNGIIQIQGDKWREQRRFSLHVLRDFGFGRTAMEEKIKFEVRALITHLNTKFNSKNTTEAFDVSKPVAVCIANIINSILFSRTYAHVW